MKREKSTREEDKEDILAQWSIPEYEKFDRKKSWYVAAGIIFIGLVSYAVFTANFLFAVILIFLAIILYLYEKGEPLLITFIITPDGIIIGNKLYSYKEIDNFYIIYEPPAVKQLYFIFKSLLKPRLSIPLQDENPVNIRKILRMYLDEDLEKEYEPLTEKIGRFFKF